MVTAPIKNLADDVFKRFPGTANWGIQNCRHIRDSATWSQHAWGNALDIGVGTNRALGDRVYAYLIEYRSRLQLGTILWWVKDHYDHIHAEGVPKYSGTPPCAGGTLQTVPGSATVGSSGLDFAGRGLVAAGAGQIKLGEELAALTPVGIAAVGLSKLFAADTWLRVIWGVGGFLTLGAGVLMLAREMGVPVPTPVEAGKAVLSTVGPGKIIKAVA